MKDKILQLAAMILDWANARNLVKGSDPKTQCLKTVSEFGELAVAVMTATKNDIKDGIGDVIVTMVICGAQMGVDLRVLLDRVLDVADLSDPNHPMSFVATGTGNLGMMADNVIKGQLSLYEQNAFHLLVNLKAIAELSGLDLATCIEAAYNEIKDRKGVMYNGAFIRDTDERYASACAELGIEG